MKWIRLFEGKSFSGKTNQNKRCLKISAGLSFETWVGASAVRWNESFSPVSVKRPWIHLRWWGGGLMRAWWKSSTLLAASFSPREGISLGTDLGSPSNWFLLLPALHAVEKSVHCCIVSIGTYGAEFRLLPRHIKTRKRIRRRNYSLHNAYRHKYLLPLADKSNPRGSFGFMCGGVVRKMRPPDTTGFVY